MTAVDQVETDHYYLIERDLLEQTWHQALDKFKYRAKALATKEGTRLQAGLLLTSLADELYHRNMEPEYLTDYMASLARHLNVSFTEEELMQIVVEYFSNETPQIIKDRRGN